MKAHLKLDGDFKDLEVWLKSYKTNTPLSSLNRAGSDGVAALQRATPIGETGKTAAGWRYGVKKSSKGYELSFYNDSHPETTANIPILLQYGHGTRNGGYVPGRDFINPALNPVFNRVSEQLLKGAVK